MQPEAAGLPDKRSFPGARGRSGWSVGKSRNWIGGIRPLSVSAGPSLRLAARSAWSPACYRRSSAAATCWAGLCNAVAR